MDKSAVLGRIDLNLGHGAAPDRALGPAKVCDAGVETAFWSVLHTRSRQEKALAQTLAGAGVAHYLPLIRRVRTYAHRKRIVQAPLFSGYVFLYGGPDATRFALETGRVARALRVADQGRFAREIGYVRTALEAGAELDVMPHLSVGRRVRVSTGAFKGIEGIIEQRCGKQRLVLQVHALNRATSLEVDAGSLEAAE